MKSKKFRDLTYDEKVVRVKTSPDIAVQLLNNQDELIKIMKAKIETQNAIIFLQEKLIDALKRKENADGHQS